MAALATSAPAAVCAATAKRAATDAHDDTVAIASAWWHAFDADADAATVAVAAADTKVAVAGADAKADAADAADDADDADGARRRVAYGLSAAATAALPLLAFASVRAWDDLQHSVWKAAWPQREADAHARYPVPLGMAPTHPGPRWAPELAHVTAMARALYDDAVRTRRRGLHGCPRRVGSLLDERAGRDLDALWFDVPRVRTPFCIPDANKQHTPPRAAASGGTTTATTADGVEANPFVEPLLALLRVDSMAVPVDGSSQGARAAGGRHRANRVKRVGSRAAPLMLTHVSPATSGPVGSAGAAASATASTAATAAAAGTDAASALVCAPDCRAREMARLQSVLFHAIAHENWACISAVLDVAEARGYATELCETARHPVRGLSVLQMLLRVQHVSLPCRVVSLVSAQHLNEVLGRRAQWRGNALHTAARMGAYLVWQHMLRGTAPANSSDTASSSRTGADSSTGTGTRALELDWSVADAFGHTPAFYLSAHPDVHLPRSCRACGRLVRVRRPHRACGRHDVSHCDTDPTAHSYHRIWDAAVRFARMHDALRAAQAARQALVPQVVQLLSASASAPSAAVAWLAPELARLVVAYAWA